MLVSSFRSTGVGVLPDRRPVAEGYGVGTARDGPRSEKILNQMPPKNSLPAALAAAREAWRAISARGSELTASGGGSGLETGR